jgi:hypothetical protein
MIDFSVSLNHVFEAALPDRGSISLDQMKGVKRRFLFPNRGRFHSWNFSSRDQDASSTDLRQTGFPCAA